MLTEKEFEILERCLSYRSPFKDPDHKSCLRLINGFYEGFPDLTVDIYASTLVIINHSKDIHATKAYLEGIKSFYLDKLPWIKCVLLKTRNSTYPEARNGELIYGDSLDEFVLENGIKYSIDLKINQDSSLYLDTRNLRKWLTMKLQGKSILNAFAYTGALGIAALAGGASRVIQTDINGKFLSLGKKSARLNNFTHDAADYFESDFFRMVDRFKTSKALFDCVIIDPPFFSVTQSGKVDLVNDSLRLINKVRPLIGHDGYLISINNSLYVPGSEIKAQIEQLCQTPYVSFEESIPVPKDVTGYPDTIITPPPTDPSPFNHPTKISIFKILRKDERKATI